MNDSLITYFTIVSECFERKGGHTFPISSIDGIPVTVLIRKGMTIGRPLSSDLYPVNFIINASECFDYYAGDVQSIELFRKSFEFDHCEISVEEMRQLILSIKEIIAILKFDKFESKFTTEKIYPMAEFHDMFKCENIEMDYKDCCVCFEATMRNTSCGHALCIPCHSKIKRTPSEDDEYYPDGEKQCPMCREQIY